ncbi:MAG: glutamine amidotransferase family protein, partial [Dehalococcoidia bacterium]|nr:glutamine amidotransferase family protein [Dehalococcoidia bacterium]
MKKIFPRIISACGLIGFMNEDRKRVPGDDIIKSITLMHERSNGLGGGFAAYGIYPEHRDDYAFHIMYLSHAAKDETERYMNEEFDISEDGPIPTRHVDAIKNIPILWRYFARPKSLRMRALSLTDEDDFVLQAVMKINFETEDAYVVSSGKNMGAFKAVGFAGDVGKFFRLDEYEAHMWIAHARFPTNTPGWWGGAHPFTLLDCSVVHNGEISSYGINRRYLEMFGYKCTLQTDTEVMAYLIDLLVRRHKLSIATACLAMAAPFWKDIDEMEESERQKAKALRMVYGSGLVNGPFAIVFGHSKGMVGFNDRIKLRPMVAGRKDETLFVASEEAAIREICPKPDRIWSPKAGEPIIAWLKPD